jgi:hypothetical protein
MIIKTFVIDKMGDTKIKKPPINRWSLEIYLI